MESWKENLESFGKRRFFKMVIEKFWNFVWEILEYPEMDTTWYRIKHRIFVYLHFIK